MQEKDTGPRKLLERAYFNFKMTGLTFGKRRPETDQLQLGCFAPNLRFQSIWETASGI